MEVLAYAGMTVVDWERGGSRLRENDKLEVVNKEIPASAGIGLGHTLPFRKECKINCVTS